MTDSTMHAIPDRPCPVHGGPPMRRVGLLFYCDKCHSPTAQAESATTQIRNEDTARESERAELLSLRAECDRLRRLNESLTKRAERAE